MAEPVLGICELSSKWWVHKRIIPNCHLTCQSQIHNSWNLLSSSWREKAEVQMPKYDQAIRTIYFSQSKCTLGFYWFPSSNMNTAISGALRITQFGSFIIFLGGKWAVISMGTNCGRSCKVIQHSVPQEWISLTFMFFLWRCRKEPCHEHFTLKAG